MPTLHPLHLRPLLTALALAASTATAATKPLIVDMIHHIPGDKPSESAYDNAVVIKPIGYNGKVYCLRGSLETGSDFTSYL